MSIPLDAIGCSRVATKLCTRTAVAGGARRRAAINRRSPGRLSGAPPTAVESAAGIRRAVRRPPACDGGACIAHGGGTRCAYVGPDGVACDKSALGAEKRGAAHGGSTSYKRRRALTGGRVADRCITTTEAVLAGGAAGAGSSTDAIAEVVSTTAYAALEDATALTAAAAALAAANAATRRYRSAAGYSELRSDRLGGDGGAGGGAGDLDGDRRDGDGGAGDGGCGGCCRR